MRLSSMMPPGCLGAECQGTVSCEGGYGTSVSLLPSDCVRLHCMATRVARRVVNQLLTEMDGVDSRQVGACGVWVAQDRMLGGVGSLRVAGCKKPASPPDGLAWLSCASCHVPYICVKLNLPLRLFLRPCRVCSSWPPPTGPT